MRLRYKFNICTVLFLLLGSILSSCEVTFNDTKESRIVASVDGTNLYLRDVPGLGVAGLTKADSMLIIDKCCDQWIRKTVIDNYSRDKYKENSNEINKLVEKYRSSLFTLLLEDDYIKLINSEVADEDIDDYYQKNMSNFVLKHPVVKARLLGIPLGYKGDKLIEKKFLSTRSSDFEDILSISERDNFFIKDFSSGWNYFSDVVWHFPFTGDVTTFLKRKKVFESKDENYSYILTILDHKLVGDIAPKELIVEKIKDVIIIERQRERMENVKDSLYFDALSLGVRIVKK